MRARIGLALLFALGISAAAQAQTSVFPGVDPVLIDDLVAANHILANEKVLDGFGHVSVRDPRNPNRYLMSRSIAPASVTANDIMEFDLDSKPIDAKGRGAYKERFIHGEIYKVRPDVNAIIHSHSPTIVPFSVTKYPLEPILHNAAFLGAGPPVFDPRDTAGPTNLLVETPALGQAIAQTLGKANIVLMRGHGDTVVGPNVRLAFLGDLCRGERSPARASDRHRWSHHLHRRRGAAAHGREHGQSLRTTLAVVEARGDAGQVIYDFGPGIAGGWPGPQ
jgi:ribulose-5-phosphate 4-epimerase/fuculose-1-phosphate aldolase